MNLIYMQKRTPSLVFQVSTSLMAANPKSAPCGGPKRKKEKKGKKKEMHVCACEV